MKATVVGLGKLTGAIELQASLVGSKGKVSEAVLNIEQEAFAYADRTKREQMEMGL